MKFNNITSRALAGIYKHFGGVYCSHLLGSNRIKKLIFFILSLWKFRSIMSVIFY